MNLEQAIRLDDPAAVQAALTAGADPNQPLPDFRLVPLRWAAGLGKNAAVLALLDGGADPVRLCVDGGDPLNLFCFANAELIPLLRERGLDPNEPRDWTSPLAHACLAEADGRVLNRRVAALLAAGADVQAPGVLFAALTGRFAQPAPLEVLDQLLEAGVDATAPVLSVPRHTRPSGGAMYYALSSGALDHARRLQEAGAPVSQPQLLTLVQQWPVVKMEGLAAMALAQIGSADAREFESSSTALAAAALGNRLDWVQWLLAHGANPNLADGRGETALGAAVRDGELPVVAHLLGAGAVPDRSRLDGMDLLSWLGKSQSRRPLVDLLLAHGATPVQRAKAPRKTKAERALEAERVAAESWSDLFNARDARSQTADAISMLQARGLACESSVVEAVASSSAFNAVVRDALGASPKEFGRCLDAQSLLNLLVPKRCVVVDNEALDCTTEGERQSFYPRLLAELAQAGEWRYTHLRRDITAERAKLSFRAFDQTHEWSLDLSTSRPDDAMVEYVDAMLAAHKPELRCWVFSNDYTHTIVTAPAAVVALWSEA